MTGGATCCVVGCSTSKKKCPALTFFSLPKKGVSDASDAWRGQLMIKIARQDKSFNPDRATICSRHFEESCFKTLPSGRIKLVLGSVPTRFMPVKSIETPKPVPRKAPMKRNFPAPSTSQDLGSEEVLAPEEAPNLPTCEGITDPKLQMYADLPPKVDDKSSDSCKYYLHVYYEHHKDKMTCRTAIRAHACEGTVSTPDRKLCAACSASKLLVLKKHARRIVAEKKDLVKYTPLSKVSKMQVAKALKQERLEKAQAKRQVRLLRAQLEEQGVEVSGCAHDRLQDIVESVQKDSLTEMFWQEQKQAFSKRQGGHRWHPMMIRLAIMIHSQSPSLYRTLRTTGIVKLPGESTLRDYTNVLHPQSGFMLDVFLELKKQAESLKDNERWVCLLHDEISIKADLVYDRVTGEVIGFVDKDHWTPSTAKDGHLATHALVFMVIGVTSNLKMSLGYFPTTTATADQIFPYFWQCIGLLETVCSLKVIASTSDKASANQRLIRMHTADGFSCTNLYAPNRKIFFFSDAPHLLKTVRNNMSSSGFGKNTKRLWNNGKEILWTHIVQLYQHDVGHELRRTRLTQEHIYLTPQSVMRVNLAAQVLSHSVGSVLQTLAGAEAEETAKFVLLMDKFFDSLNVRSTAEGKKKRNPYLEPYTSVDDHRFQFLADEFMGYIENWKQSVEARPGFTKSAKNKMFLTYQTYEGLKTTVNSAIAATQYLLQSGVSMVLTQKFCQDPLEEHFGRHRALGIRAENPTLWTFGYQENKLRLQRSLALSILPKGNIRSKRAHINVAVDPTPLAKIRRRRT